MKANNTAKNIVLAIMVIVSFANLFGVSATGISVILGIAFFFIFKIIEKQTFQDVGFDIKLIGKNLKELKIWLWVLMPLVINTLAGILAKLILPGYTEHIISRSSSMLSVNLIGVLIIQLAVFALGEEIAWRGFFQKQVKSFMPIAPAILISSALFSLGHLTGGNVFIVVYDLLFIFINSLFYGIIFEKTNNAWISAISHFIANLFSAVSLFFL